MSDLPPGFTLEEGEADLPTGFTLEAPPPATAPAAQQETPEARRDRLRSAAMGAAFEPMDTFGRPPEASPTLFGIPGSREQIAATEEARIAERKRVVEGLANLRPAIDAATRELGAPVQIGQAPFRAQVGASFSPSGTVARPFEQLMPDYEFRTISTPGPLQGQQVYRRKGSNDPFTTVENPLLATGREVAAAVPGMAPGLVLGAAGGIAGTILERAGFPRGGIIGAGFGTGAGEAVRQTIGRRGFGINPLPPGMTEEQAVQQGLMERAGGLTRAEASGIVTEGIIGSAAQGIGNAITGLVKAFRRAGTARIDPDQYAANMEVIRKALANAVGPDEADRALQRVTAADMAASMEQGAVLEAQVERLRRSGQGDAFRRAEAEKERYLVKLARKLLNADERQTQNLTSLGQAVQRAAPEVPPETPLPPDRAAVLQQAEATREQQMQRMGVSALEELTRGRAATSERRVGETVAGTAPRGGQAIPGARISPDSLEAAQVIREGVDAARENTLRPLSAQFENVYAAVGDTPQTPDNVLAVAERYRERLARRLFPTIDPEADPIIQSVFNRAFGAPGYYLDEFDNLVETPPELLPRTLRQLREDSSNLKEALRRANKGTWNGEVGMLNDFIKAIDEDIITLVRKAGGEQLAEEYRGAINGYREAMDLFQRSGKLKDIQALKAGGAEVVGDERVAGTIFAGADNSRAVREAFDALEPAQRDQAIETVRSTLRWEIARRAAPGTGEDISPQSMANVLRDNEQILSSWFTPAELQTMQTQAAQINRARRAMGVKADQDFGDWFDNAFAEARPENIARIYDSIRRALPATGPDSAEETINTLRSLTQQRIYQRYAKRDENGQLVINAQKFWSDHLDDPKIASHYAAVFGPSYSARARQLAQNLSDFANNTSQNITALRNTITTESAQARAAAALRKPIAEAAEKTREMLGVGGGKFNATAWAEARWNEADVDNIAQIVRYLGAKDPAALEAFRNLMKNKLLREVLVREPVAKLAATDIASQNSISTDKLLQIVTDPARREWLTALFGSPSKAYGQLEKMLITVSMLRPDQAKVILTQTTDPSLVSLEQFRRARNVIFGPLNPKSRIATRVMEWGGDRLRERAAEALIRPEKFLEMQAALRPTSLKAVAGSQLILQEPVRYLVPEGTADAIQKMRDFFQP